MTTEAKALINQAFSETLHKFSTYIFPIYAFIESSDPIAIGTCFAIEYRGRKFLVTAAHVMDNTKKAELALVSPSSRAPVSISGEFHIVHPGKKARNDDPFDFAWHELTSEEALVVPCIPETDIEISYVPKDGAGLYVGIGFPVSKNKKIRPEDRRARRLTPQRAQYMNVQTDAVGYFQEREMSPETHIAIVRENRSINGEGVEENTIGHKGLSGGPLIDTGLRRPSSTTIAPKVSGILLENDQKSQVMVALRLSVVLRHMDLIIEGDSGKP